MKNVTKKWVLVTLAICLLFASANPVTASAAAYKKSISKEFAVARIDIHGMPVYAKKATKATVTVKVTDKDAFDFYVQDENTRHDSNGKKKVSYTIKLAKGENFIFVGSENENVPIDAMQNVKFTIKSKKAYLKFSNQ